MDVRVGLQRKLNAEELLLLNCGVGECRGPAPADPGYSKERRLGEGQGITA